jgi:2',3'-cyclic-nucleotide 2'-phosphodiesterase (5'-nucleotidase family)
MLGTFTVALAPRFRRWSVATLAVLALTVPATYGSDLEFHVLFTSEILGYLQQDQESGHVGVPTICHAVEKWSSSFPRDSYLIVDVGDALAYYYLSQVDSGRTIFSMLAGSGYVAMVPGNFDFSYGWQNLCALNESSDRFRMLSANVCDSLQKPVLPPYQIFERQGVRIAVIGFSDPAMVETVAEHNLQPISLLDPVDVISNLETELQGRYDLMIVLTHLGFEQNLRLSKAGHHIDLIIARPQDNAPREYSRVVYGQDGRSTIIVQATAGAAAIGHISFHLENGNMTRLHLAEEPLDIISPTEQWQHKLADLQSRYDQQCVRRFGRRADDQVAVLDSADFQKEVIRQNLAVMLKSTHSEVALINQGYFRFYPLRDGHLTIRDVDRFGWSNDHICIMRLRGATLRALEEKSKALPEQSKRRLRFMSVQNCALAENEPWTVHGKSIQDDEEYAVVTNQFLSSGTDGYEELKEKRYFKNRFNGTLRITSDRQGREIPINELFIRHLVADSATNRQVTEAAIATDPYLNKPLWQLIIQQFEVGLSNIQVKTSESYENASESRISNQVKGSHNYNLQMNVGLTRESKRVQWQSALWAVYANTTVRPLGSEPLTSKESNLEWTQLADVVNRLQPRLLNPFASLRFDSDLDFLQRDLFTSLGIKVGTSSDAELRLAVITKWNALTRSTSNGLEVNGGYDQCLLGIDNEGWLRLRFLAGKDDAMLEQEQYSMEWRNSFKIPLSENMSLVPTIELFYYKGQNIPSIARNVQLSFNLSYSRKWKFQYQKFFRKEDKKQGDT